MYIHISYATIYTIVWNEFYKDTVVYNLRNGIEDAKKTTKRVTQDGQAKVTGRKSILEDRPEGNWQIQKGQDWDQEACHVHECHLEVGQHHHGH